MSVKRYSASIQRCGEIYEAECVLARDYDKVLDENAELRIECDEAKSDRQYQYNRMVKARMQRDTLAAENKLLRKAVREFAGFLSSDDPKHWELHALADGSALTTANGEVNE
jgi:hypothetical protein